MHPTAGAALLVLALAAAGLKPGAAWGYGSWVDARGTFYGRDAWSLHDGSCGFGFVCPNRWSDQLRSGYDMVALSDQSPLYKSDGSACGQCLEIQCRDATIKDGFGQTFDRHGMCHNGQMSVKVKVADTCQCNYAPNAVSNRRWCCGDYPHLDVSQWALDKIVQDTTKWGVFAIRYRTIPCDAPIPNQAPNPAHPAPDPHAGDKPANMNCASQGSANRKRRVRSRGMRRGSRRSRRHMPRVKYYKRSASGAARPYYRNVFPHPKNKGGYHSALFWARRRAYERARKHHHSKSYYRRLVARFKRMFGKR